MKSLIFSLFSLAVCLGCSSRSPEYSASSEPLKAAGVTADFLQMTQDHEGNVIAWWIEEDEDTEEKWVFLAKSSGPELLFEAGHRVLGTRDVSTGGENMPKLVVKPDGTYILVFSRSNKQSNAPFAGSVLYIQSFDEGESWTGPELIHSDTNPDNSHAFSTAILLPNGEVGAVWIDGRHRLEHSVLYFARTNGREGFGMDKRIGGPSCQCCKLFMYVDDSQTLHLAYRSLTEDNIRDIAHITSADSGQSFSSPSVIHHDNWQIVACPHNGPAITQTKQGMMAVWYTLGGEEGIYYAGPGRTGEGFSSRKKLTERGKHPYVASLGDTALAVWDEVFRDRGEAYQRVRMSRISGGEVVEEQFLSPAGVEAAMPYLLELDNGDVIATWTQYSEKGNELHYPYFSEQPGRQLALLSK